MGNSRRCLGADSAAAFPRRDEYPWCEEECLNTCRCAARDNLKNVNVDIPRDALVVHRRLRIGEIFISLRDALRRGPAALSGIRHLFHTVSIGTQSPSGRSVMAILHSSKVLPMSPESLLPIPTDCYLRNPVVKSETRFGISNAEFLPRVSFAKSETRFLIPKSVFGQRVGFANRNACLLSPSFAF